MALALVSDLRTSITSWLYGRSDIAAQADDFIKLAESSINYGIRDPATGQTVKLRTRNMETTTTITPDSNGQATIPTDYLEFRQVTSTDNPRRNLNLIAPSFAEERYGYRESDLPDSFAIIGTKIHLYPVSTTEIELTYYAKVPALSDSNTSNWLLTAYPNIYLDGSLYHASRWLRNNDADMAMFLTSFVAGMQTLSDSDTSGRWSRASSSSSGQKP